MSFKLVKRVLLLISCIFVLSKAIGVIIYGKTPHIHQYTSRSQLNYLYVKGVVSYTFTVKPEKTEGFWAKNLLKLKITMFPNVSEHSFFHKVFIFVSWITLHFKCFIYKKKKRKNRCFWHIFLNMNVIHFKENKTFIDLSKN